MYEIGGAQTAPKPRNVYEIGGAQTAPKPKKLNIRLIILNLIFKGLHLMETFFFK